MLLSIVIPVRNENGNIRNTSSRIVAALEARNIPFEMILVNDHSTDQTPRVLSEIAAADPLRRIRTIESDAPHGFGMAIQSGLNCFQGDAVAIVMGDLSDAPEDIAAYYDRIVQGAECVFGSRFMPGSEVIDYPPIKYVLNRLANQFIQMLFGLRYNDVTNAFKCYRREVIEGLRPILSHHFNLTVELPLKAIVRGYTYEVIPIRWTNRTVGVSKLKIQEMGSRYLFIVLYVLLEKLLSKGDYRRHSGRIVAHDRSR
jgi:dolichol-phosphate mannosyltransferase